MIFGPFEATTLCKRAMGWGGRRGASRPAWAQLRAPTACRAPLPHESSFGQDNHLVTHTPLSPLPFGTSLGRAGPHDAAAGAPPVGPEDGGAAGQVSGYPGYPP